MAFKRLAVHLIRSQWLFAALQASGLAVELLETRHVRDAFKAMPVKTDCKDARHCPTHAAWLVPARALQVTAEPGGSRSADEAQAAAVEAARCRDEHRGVLRGFGLKVGPTTPKRVEQRVRELVAHHDTLEQIAEALLKARTGAAW
ncbi:hypothetical protein [Mesorhizobium sp. M0140]|uniref:hypothetical protein n=1 Tax=Mesorhizobium sp. M0140 TaxID=2956893 RepID=UPI00333D8740